jgi:hypothetical protein
MRKPNSAAMLSLLKILLVPYALFFGFYIMASNISVPNWFSVLIFTNILGLASGFFFAQNAHMRLTEYFRQVVAEGVPPRFRAEAEEAGTPALEGAE